MQGDLISRKELIEKFNDTGVQITFDLPVEEVLGEDVDIDDFAMLVQDAIQSYKKMVIGVIQEQPTAYSVEDVVEQTHEIFRNELRLMLKPLPDGTEYPEEAYRLLYLNDCVCGTIRNGGKE
jgi:hypothetical protein